MGFTLISITVTAAAETMALIFICGLLNTGRSPRPNVHPITGRTPHCPHKNIPEYLDPEPTV